MNNKLLNQYIHQFAISTIAKHLDMTIEELTAKLNGKDDIFATEMINLTKLLNITDPTEIFFGTECKKLDLSKFPTLAEVNDQKKIKEIQTTQFTEEDKHLLFEATEMLDEINTNIAKCNSVADMLTEALARMSEAGSAPTDSSVILDVVAVIFDYSYKANCELQTTYEELFSLYRSKCSLPS